MTLRATCCLHWREAYALLMAVAHSDQSALVSAADALARHLRGLSLLVIEFLPNGLGRCLSPMPMHLRMRLLHQQLHQQQQQLMSARGRKRQRSHCRLISLLGWMRFPLPILWFTSPWTSGPDCVPSQQGPLLAWRKVMKSSRPWRELALSCCWGLCLEA